MHPSTQHILTALQSLEEAGGPEGEEYVTAMHTVIDESLKRLSTYMKRNTFTVTLETEPVQRADGYRLGCVLIMGVAHHLELFEVIEDGDHIHRAANPIYHTKVEAILNELVGEAPHLIELDGLDYLAVVTPYGR